MKKIMWSILFIALISVPHASAQAVDYHSHSAVSFYGTYTPPKEAGEEQSQGGDSTTGSQSSSQTSSSNQSLPKTGENDSASLPLGLLFLGLAFFIKRKFASEVKETL